jgi:hypothetical protein
VACAELLLQLSHALPARVALQLNWSSDVWPLAAAALSQVNQQSENDDSKTNKQGYWFDPK